MRRLLRMAASMGTSVAYADLHGELDGIYYHRRRGIWLALGMSRDNVALTLAHELGHAAHGHTRSTRQSEAEADDYAQDVLHLIGRPRLAAMIRHPSRHVRDVVLPEPLGIPGEDLAPVTPIDVLARMDVARRAAER